LENKCTYYKIHAKNKPSTKVKGFNMYRSFLKSKIHRATVTDSNLNYVGSISLCPHLMEAADILVNEEVHILNCNNGARFTTYAIEGQAQDVILNGAAARLIQPGDIILVLTYCSLKENEIQSHTPKVLLVDEKNAIKSMA
jgi:aspartate 1-decarboxylase